MTKQELETKLQRLRDKWRGHVPKSNADPSWWAFKCDNCIATGLKSELENLNRGIQSEISDYEQAKAIFT